MFPTPAWASTVTSVSGGTRTRRSPIPRLASTVRSSTSRPGRPRSTVSFPIPCSNGSSSAVDAGVTVASPIALRPDVCVDEERRDPREDDEDADEDERPRRPRLSTIATPTTTRRIPMATR